MNTNYEIRDFRIEENRVDVIEKHVNEKIMEMRRSKEPPHLWELIIAKSGNDFYGKVLDRDRYSNDLIERIRIGKYEQILNMDVRNLYQEYDTDGAPVCIECGVSYTNRGKGAMCGPCRSVDLAECESLHEQGMM